MKRLKVLNEYIILKLKGFNKDERMLRYAIKGIITFDEYNKYYDNKVMKRGE